MSESKSSFTQGFVVVIGRAHTCDIVIDDPKVSRKHLAVVLAGGTVHVLDLESRNGTRINGEDKQRAELQPGDRLSCGALFDDNVIDWTVDDSGNSLTLSVRKGDAQ